MDIENFAPEADKAARLIKPEPTQLKPTTSTIEVVHVKAATHTQPTNNQTASPDDNRQDKSTIRFWLLYRWGLIVQFFKQHAGALRDWLMVISTIAIAATGTIGLWIFNGQLQEMKTASKDTRDLAVQAKVSADSTKIIANKLVELSQSTNKLAESALTQTKATNQLAKAATTQSIIAEKSLALATAADRPWIGLQPPPNDTFDVNKAADIPIAIINAGKSPARIIQSIVACALLPNFPKNPNYGVIINGNNSRATLVPGASVMHTYKFPGTSIQQAIHNFKIGTLKFYVYSRVTYEDIWTHRTHHTFGCFFWSTKDNKFVYSSEYNDAD
jgi:hypothetical protein